MLGSFGSYGGYRFRRPDPRRQHPVRQTTGGGTNGYGTVFSVPVSGGSPTVLASFNGSNGEMPTRPHAQRQHPVRHDRRRRRYGDGTVFSVPVSGGSPTTLASFNGSNGKLPYAGLTLSANGSTLYGTTEAGGANGNGTVFSMYSGHEKTDMIPDHGSLMRQ